MAYFSDSDCKTRDETMTDYFIENIKIVIDVAATKKGKCHYDIFLKG